MPGPNMHVLTWLKQQAASRLGHALPLNTLPPHDPAADPTLHPQENALLDAVAAGQLGGSRGLVLSLRQQLEATQQEAARLKARACAMHHYHQAHG